MREIKNERIDDLAKSMKFKWDEGEINHRISAIAIPIMQTFGFLLALSVVYGIIIKYIIT